MNNTLLILTAVGLPLLTLNAQVPATNEPTNAKEAAAKKAEADARIEKAYQAWLETLSPERRNWEEILQASLGSFYLPLHKADKVAKRSNAWDFVEDDPKLPRILLIGDSVSRGYTQAVRDAMRGKANVHRAPENCGPTANGLRKAINDKPKIDLWLGNGKWDVIHFNFGIHDRATPLPDYTQRLEQLVDRMKQTGATLVWATTTPIPEDPAKNQRSASIVERNSAAEELMKRKAIAIDDLFSAITPRLAELQNPNDVHFNAAGYEFLGKQVASSIEAALKARAR